MNVAQAGHITFGRYFSKTRATSGISLTKTTPEVPDHQFSPTKPRPPLFIFPSPCIFLEGDHPKLRQCSLRPFLTNLLCFYSPLFAGQCSSSWCDKYPQYCRSPPQGAILPRIKLRKSICWSALSKHIEYDGANVHAGTAAVRVP